MNRVAAASGAFDAFGSILCILIVKGHLDTMEFALYKLIISYHIICVSGRCGSGFSALTASCTTPRLSLVRRAVLRLLTVRFASNWEKRNDVLSRWSMSCRLRTGFLAAWPENMILLLKLIFLMTTGSCRDKSSQTRWTSGKGRERKELLRRKSLHSRHAVQIDCLRLEVDEA